MNITQANILIWDDMLQYFEVTKSNKRANKIAINEGNKA